MTAYEAFNDLLDCNEIMENFKSQNTDNVPDMNLIKMTTLLVNYRELLIKQLKETDLGLNTNEIKFYIRD